MASALFVRSDYTPDELEALAARIADKAHARRLCAIAAVLKGANRREAASIGGMQRQTLRDWVERFNAEGPEGLISRKPPGRPTKLSPGQKRELIAILASPSVKLHCGVSRWRLADIVSLIQSRYGVALNATSVGRMLRALEFTDDGEQWPPADGSPLSSVSQKWAPILG